MSNEIDKANGNAVTAALPQWLVSIRQAVTKRNRLDQAAKLRDAFEGKN